MIPSCPPSALSANNRAKKGRKEWDLAHKSTVDCRTEAGWEAKAQWFNDPITFPIDVIVYVIWPKSSLTPDIDALGSYCKPYFDGLNKIVWEDDSLVKRVMYEQESASDSMWRNGAIGIMMFDHVPVVRRI